MGSSSQSGMQMPTVASSSSISSSPYSSYTPTMSNTATTVATTDTPMSELKKQTTLLAQLVANTSTRVSAKGVTKPDTATVVRNQVG
jgi:hypothetical protein